MVKRITQMIVKYTCDFCGWAYETAKEAGECESRGLSGPVFELGARLVNSSNLSRLARGWSPIVKSVSNVLIYQIVDENWMAYKGGDRKVRHARTYTLRCQSDEKDEPSEETLRGTQVANCYVVLNPEAFDDQVEQLLKSIGRVERILEKRSQIQQLFRELYARIDTQPEDQQPS